MLTVSDTGDDEPWERTPIQTEHNWANITNLTPGGIYEIQVVAVNGGGEETRSTPKTITVGPREGNGRFP